MLRLAGWSESFSFSCGLGSGRAGVRRGLAVCGSRSGGGHDIRCNVVATRESSWWHLHLFAEGGEHGTLISLLPWPF